MVGLLTVCLFFSFYTASVLAQGNIGTGKTKFEAEISYKGEYNDNIYSADGKTATTPEQDDFIHTVTPSLRLRFDGAPGNFFSAGYNVDIVAYSDFSSNNYETHKPSVSLGFKSPAGFYLKASDNYLNTADPYGTDNQYKLGTPNTERWTNSLNLTVGHTFAGSFGIEGMYKNYLERFDLQDDKWQDRIDHVYGVTLLYKITPKTSLLAQYRRTDAEYDSQNDGVAGRGPAWTKTTSQDYDLNDAFFGVRFEPGGKVTGEIKLGYGDKNFDNIVDNSGNRYEDESTWVAETSVNYSPIERTRFTLDFARSQTGSPDSDASTYVDTKMGLRLRQGLAHRFTLNLGAEWSNNDYQVYPGIVDKYFDVYTIKAGLDWDIKKWLSAGIDYEYKSKEASNEAAYGSSEYKSNRTSARISAKF